MREKEFVHNFRSLKKNRCLADRGSKGRYDGGLKGMTTGAVGLLRGIEDLEKLTSE